MKLVDDSYFQSILNHYKNVWNADPKLHKWEPGPNDELPTSFRVAEFSPSDNKSMWTYATCNLSVTSDIEGIELHMFSEKKDPMLIELLTTVSYYHRNISKLNLNHTVNFGRPWQDSSLCTYGLISLPYLDGPILENLDIPELNKNVKFLWLIPITLEECNYKKDHGIERLEQKFEEYNFNYLLPGRKSVV
ncbi:suppressor of fused domain protein [Mucilaginibacter sp.]|uniref:suppressor of fused domain protein n=1 Tax=Mucilaginibacter sp. TaxID=1882438 RepID=UPI0035BC8B04